MIQSHKFARAFVPALAAGLLAGCATTIPQESKDRPLIVDGMEREVSDQIPDRRSAMYLRTYRTPSLEMARPMTVRGVSLLDIIEEALPGYRLVPKDTQVPLTREVSLNMPAVPVEDFLESLANTTGVDFKLNGTEIEARSITTQEWYLPMLAPSSTSDATVSGASQGSGGSSLGGGGGSSLGGGGGGGSSGGRSISATFDRAVDEWDGIIQQAKDIIGATSGRAATRTADSAGGTGAIDEGVQPSEPQIVDIKSIGYIRAYGDVGKIRQLDRYLSGLEKASRKQVRLDVRSLEVSFTDSRSRGINWNAAVNTIFNDAMGSAGISLGADYTVPVTPGDGTFSVSADVVDIDDRIDAMINFLSSYGNVELRNNPQVTVFNGRTAYIGSGREFGFVSSIERTVTNGVVVTTPTISRILVGVELAITPTVTADDKIVLTVVPIISTFEGFDDFLIDGSQISQPRIVLNQLATQVITAPGQTVHLGGLVTSRLNEAVRSLPLAEQGFMRRILDPLFSGEANDLERRELIIVVTPYLSNA